MKVKFGLQLKFTLLFMGIMLFIVFSVRLFLYGEYADLLNQQQLNYAVSIARIIEDMVTEEELQEYAAMGQEDEQYYQLIEQMKKIQESSKVYYLYIVIVETEEKGIYFVDLKLNGEKSTVNHKLGEENLLKMNYPGLSDVLESKTASGNFDRVYYGEESLDSVYVPIINQEGTAAAFVGIDFSETLIAKNMKKQIDNNMKFLLTIIFFSFFLLCFIVRFSVLKRIHKLKEYAKQVSEGNFHDKLSVRGHDELSDIFSVFNWMSESIAGHMEEMQVMNDAYYRYVPSKILLLLKKERIMDIKLGNETSAMLTVFSLQLADFDRTIRKKSAKEMIDAINQVLHVSVPVIVEKEGMIEGFQNAGFTALFDNNSEAALLCAIKVCQKLNHMVRIKQLEKNRAGIGIAYGAVTLGIVGQEKRLAPITVSQYRDTACWLQKIAEQYQAHILITRTAADNIPHFFDTYHTRTLGFLYNTYTGYTDRIYDVYDGDSREEIELKDMTKELFERGVELYCIRNFEKARHEFIEVLKRFRKDKAAKEYLYLCDKYSRQENQKEIEIYFTKME
ncbi:MAG: HAMP domain-containing protein [Lachnospiraceae bacterium]|nr:HAMP domain-containing protein [Lachnospiraceae bacterium]